MTYQRTLVREDGRLLRCMLTPIISLQILALLSSSVHADEHVDLSSQLPAVKVAMQVFLRSVNSERALVGSIGWRE